MNNGKVCVSICAKTANEVAELFRRAEPLADVIEARFDCLEGSEIDRSLSELKSSRPVLFTYRPANQGGHAPDDPMRRIMFWASSIANTSLELGRIWVDMEGDLAAAMNWSDEATVISSFHDFEGCPEDLETIYEQLSQTGIAKIAVTAPSVTDCIPVWKILDRARGEDKRIIPIAMGEAGKWTRILGLAHGAFMTYAPLESGAETAPGQVSATDLVEVFRAKELDRDTKVHGIIAGDTSYSISPWMHNAAFKAAGLNRVFVPLQVANLEDFFKRMVKPETREVELNLTGFSVTNPHKQTIIGLLDELDETAAKIGAVNTVSIEGDKFIGFNTDAPGFIAPLKKSFGDLNGARVAVAGAGGAARACIYALQNEGAEVELYVRDTIKAAAFANDFQITVKEFPGPIDNCEADILVNATPLGTKGETVDKTIVSADQLKDVKLVYDLIYNPSETVLIREAKAAGIPAIGGLEMLVAQGEKQFEIWTGETAPREAMTAAVRKKLNI